jgi:hypothetical protein
MNPWANPEISNDSKVNLDKGITQGANNTKEKHGGT